MIFTTTGTCVAFDRLICHLDRIAPQLGEELIVQRGESAEMVHCESFAYAESLEAYFRRARLVISHGGFSCLEVIRRGIPLIIVPRLAKYHEHFNDHQLDFAELLQRKFAVKYVVDCEELTPGFLRSYHRAACYSDLSLKSFREKILPVLRNEGGKY